MNPNTPYNTGALQNMVSKVKVYCSKIIPLVFDNTLSYYESLCACVAKVNELCDALNAQNLTIVEFTHMVEVELDKFEKYVQAELTSYGERITEIEGAITEIRGTIDTINEELSHKVDKRTDVTDNVIENSEQVITSGGIYHALRNDIPDATTQSKGVVQIGDGIQVVDGVISPRIATHEHTGVVKPTNALLITQDGSLEPRLASKERTGIVQVGDNIDITQQGLISVPDGDYGTKGALSVGANLTVNNGIVDVPVASNLQRGVMATGSGLSASNGVVSVNVTNSVTQGDNRPVSSDAVYDALDNIDDYIPDASYTEKGKVTVDATSPAHALTLYHGVLDVNDASPTTKGVVRVGENIDVNAGVISVATADAVTKGVVGVDTLSGNISLNNGIIDVPDATSSTKGVFRVTNTLTEGDTTHVPTADCVYQAVQQGGQGYVPDATTTTKGIVQVGENINVNEGTISVPNATSSTKGVVKYGNNFNLNGNGQLAINVGNNISTTAGGALTVANATTTNRGLVQVGDNIDVDANSVISVPTADATTKGVVGVDALGGNITLNNGIIDVPTGTTTTKGVLSVGDNLEVSGGRVSVPTADGTTKGVVTVDTLSGNISINNGVIDVATGTKTNKGVLQVGQHLSVSGGVVDVPVADDLGTYGVVAPSLNSAVTINQGEIDVKNATTTAKGAVTLANSVTSGDTTHVPTADAVYNAITGASVADATTSSKGVVQVGENINVSSGVISVPNGATGTKGVVEPDTNSTIQFDNGKITCNNAKPVVAESGNYGTVRIGSVADTSLEIDQSTYELKATPATASQMGVVKADTNSTIQFDNGKITCNNAKPAIADSGNYGTVRIGTEASTGLLLDSSTNNLKISKATASQLGGITVGDNLIVSDGRVSVPLAGATSSVAGVVAIDRTNTPLYTDHLDGEILKIRSATTSTSGIVTKTASIASGNTDVPTSEAVYSAIQGSSPLGRLILPTTRENFVSGADCFISTNYSDYNVGVNVDTTVLSNSEIVFGINSFACKKSGACYMWIKKELITTSAALDMFDIMSKIYPICLKTSSNLIPAFTFKQNSTDRGSNIEYLVFTITNSTTEPNFYSIYI